MIVPIKERLKMRVLSFIDSHIRLDIREVNSALSTSNKL